ncbi:hypothetical protein HNY73_022332 [Argiope bruennichi]|uniref:Uncharacterized protein n=1 Tax=Argiope bruennichi TaxID=94029 RepID=A0A8T0E0D1_ARGBR|nr:hypothetical protein HNY73_022332 [Argiope bruennichi]
MMFCLILLSSFIAVKGTENSFYPFIIPISTGRGHSQHTTHVFTHPVIRTQVLVLGAGDHQPQSSDEQYRDGYHYDQKFQQTYKYRPNDYRDEPSIHQPRAHGLSPSAKYSIPVEQSSWKPIRSIPLDYLPLKYLGEDGPAVAKVVYESMSASKHSSDDDDEGPLILPVGIKKLHNPQLRDLQEENRNTFMLIHQRISYIGEINMTGLPGWIDLKLLLLLVFTISEVSASCCHSYYPVYYPVHVGGG